MGGICDHIQNLHLSHSEFQTNKICNYVLCSGLCLNFKSKNSVTLIVRHSVDQRRSKVSIYFSNFADQLRPT